MYDDIELYVNNKYLSDEQVNVQEINNEDLMLLAKLINSEVGSLTTEAQIACGSVVMNRVHSNNFPNSIRDVIYQTGQYAVVENGRINLEPSELSFQNAKYILENGSQIPQNVVYQSMSAQGSGIYKVIDGEYYCYE